MKKKIITISAVAALVLALLVGGTIAYFTDQTDTKQNTFTVGKVDIDLTETSPAAEGYVQGVATDNGFKYEKILPGEILSKKPVITVNKDSEDAYVYAELTVKGYNELYAAMVKAGLQATDFSTLLKSPDLGSDVVDHWMDDNDNFHIVYAKGPLSAGNTWTLFDGVMVPSAFTQDMVESLGTIELDVKGYAIQESEITGTADGWSKLGVHTPVTND